MGHLYQRGTVWWIKYSRAGLAFYESSGSTKHAEGKRLLKLREGATASAAYRSPRRWAGCGSTKRPRTS